MNKETYAQAFEVWHKSDPVLRGEDYYDVLGFMQDADREVERLEVENAALREKLAAAVKNMCVYCTSEKWDHGCDPNCHRCEWKELHNKVFGGQDGEKE